ncbi:MAG: MYG1 family protein [Parachlamydiales bacterium]|nr:MYG1 family protein [Parachlamydiales bacterium]
MQDNEIIKKSFGTHDGSFHADEVTACAFLLLYHLIDKDKIHRTRDMTVLKTCEYVCDVGGKYDPAIKRFDHHQKEYTGDMSSAGMILLYLKNEGLMDEHLYHHFNNTLVKSVDAHDIGKIESKGCSFSQVIANFLPIEYNSTIQEKNEAFLKAVEFTYGHLKRTQDRYFYTRKCLDKVKEKLEPKRKYIIFDESFPWIDCFFELGGESHPALFILMPTGKHWKLRGIPPDAYSKMMVRLPLPLEWAGLHNDDLKKVSKIKGAIFCHKGRFISIWETKEDAIQALKYVLSKAGVDYGNDL